MAYIIVGKLKNTLNKNRCIYWTYKHVGLNIKKNPSFLSALQL